MAHLNETAVARWRSGIARGIAALLVAVATFAPVSPVGAIDPATAVVSTGAAHSCAVDTDGTLWCWGYANTARGYLGDGTTNASTTPVQIGTDTDWAMVSAGSTHSCAIKTNGSLYCWGNNYYGALGTGSFEPVFGDGSLVPVQVGSDTNWRSVSSGYVNTCAVKSDDTLYCWGYNANGQIGDGTTDARAVPTLVGSGFLGVSVGSRHSCALATDNTIRCWGRNAFGGLGDGTTTDRTTPVTVGADTNWTGVSAGVNYSCATKSNGTVWCWGLNTYGEIGSLDGLGLTGPGISAPAQIGSDTDWSIVTAGDRQSCATKTDGSLYCWGQNKKGELGGGGADADPHPTPVLFVNVPDPAPVEPDPVIEDEPVAFALPFFGVQAARAAGDATWSEVRVSAHACATTSDDRIYCWGDGAAGALGQGNTASSKAPLQVALGEPAAPAIVTDPSIDEVPELGVELTGLAGSWTGAPVPTFEFQWYRCTRTGSAVTGTRVPSGCTKLTGATSLSYTPGRSDVTKRLRLAVKATNTLGSVTRFSATSSAVVAAPFNSSAPVVSGTTRVGRTLSARAGVFGGTSPISYGYQWFACTSKVRASATLDGSCVAIGGATGSRLSLTRAEAGKFIVVGVTATNAYGSATHYSNASAAVR